jgi:hypothetical protein
MAGTEKARIEIDTSVNQKGLEKGLKKSKEIIKDFTKGAIQEFAGLDQVLAAAASGPVAIGKAFIDMGKQAVTALDAMAASYREQEQAEVALRNATKGNPFLDDNNVKRLSQFASEMQRITGLDSVMVTQAEARLATYGRSQEQIQKIVKTAADMAAARIMDFDSAVDSLSATYSGTVRISKQFNDALKGLSKEALASGEAVDFIAGKVDGMATMKMKTGTGSVTRFENAISNLKKIAGEGWEKFLKGPRDALAEVAEGIEDHIKHQRSLKEAQEEIRKLTVEQQEEIDRLREKQKEYELAVIPVLGTEKEKEIRRLWDEAEDRIKEIQQLAIQMNTYSEANLVIQEDILKKYKDEATEIKKGIEDYKLLHGGGWGMMGDSAIDETLNKLEGAEQRYNAQKWLIQQINNELAKRPKPEPIIDKNADVELENFRQKYTETLRKTNAEILKDAYLRNKIGEEEYQRLLIINNTSEETGTLFKEQISSIELQNSLLDSQISAYKGLLEASNGLLDGTLEYEQSIEKTIQAAVTQAETDKRNDEDRKKRLSDLVKLQEETQSRLNKMYEDAVSEADKLNDTGKEQAFQDELTEIRKKSIVDAVEFEAGYRQQQREIEYQNQLAEIANNETLQRERLKRIRDAELEAAGDSAAQREEIEKKYNDDILTLEETSNITRQQLDANFQEQRRQAEIETEKAISQARKEALMEILAGIQTYLNAANELASGISTIWKNMIDCQLNEDIKKNNKLIQSDEERARKEKELTITAANEKHKADLYQWSSNMIMAVGQGAMAIMNALTTVQPWPAAIAAAIVAGAMSTIQQATILSARPQAPRFHTGGVVEGIGEQSAVLMGGEVVQTQRQFQNTMRAISNLASTNTGNSGLQMNVKMVITILFPYYGAEFSENPAR